MNEANASVEWLEIQKHQLQTRRDALKKPKGMKSGLIIFGLFSLFCVLAPLMIVPFSANDYYYYLIIKCIAISVFTIGLLAIFIYLISLLKWKEE